MQLHLGLVLIKQNLADAQIFIENWASEKSYYDKLPLTLDRLKSENGIYESEGKIWLKSSEVGDEKDRVIVREDGRGTYLGGIQLLPVGAASFRPEVQMI